MAISTEAYDTVIVEDDDSCRALLDKFLRVRGHVTGCAASLAEARSMLGGDCKRVILDLSLPDGEGTELLRHIRDANLPIKVAVAARDPGTGRLAQGAGRQAAALFA